MANRYATKTGVWSDVTVWDGGVALPTTGDVVRPNTFTVTIDQNINVGELRNDAAAPAAAGGTFTITTIPGGGRTVTANITQLAGTTFVTNSATGGPLTVTGNITGANAGTTVTLSLAAGTTTIINGNITGPNFAGSGAGNTISATGTSLTINGNVVGGAGSITSSGNRSTISGGGGVITVNGNVTGGPATGSASGQAAGIAVGAGTLTVDGTVTGGVALMDPGLLVTGTPTVDIDGPVVATADCAAVNASGQTGGIIRFRGPMVDASNGRAAVLAPFAIFPKQPAKTSMTIMADAGFPTIGGAVILANYEDNGLPDPADVRYGTVYGPNGELTGSRHAALSTGDVWSYPAADADTPGSIGLRLRDAATVATTGAQIAAATDGI